MIVNRNLFIERVLPTRRAKTDSEEMEHYREPFREPIRKPVWRWPNELPIAGEPREVVEIVDSYNRWLQKTNLPKILFYGSPGKLVNSSVVDWCTRNLVNLSVVDIGRGIHYLQEDNPHLDGGSPTASPVFGLNGLARTNR